MMDNKDQDSVSYKDDFEVVTSEELGKILKGVQSYIKMNSRGLPDQLLLEFNTEESDKKFILEMMRRNKGCASVDMILLDYYTEYKLVMKRESVVSLFGSLVSSGMVCRVSSMDDVYCLPNVVVKE